MTPPPPLTALEDLPRQLQSAGFAVLTAQALARRCDVDTTDLQGLQSWWDDLPPDPHLRDGGRYRRRRHGSFVVDAGGPVVQAPHRAHWQPVEYNALHGGFERWFDPLHASMAADAAFRAVLQGLAGVASDLRPGVSRWFVEAHAFRIDCTDGIGRPTPEGAHRDGVDLVAVILLGRRHIRGGETRVFDARSPQGMRFTLAEPWSALLLDDERVIHETTPIQPVDATDPGWRDTLVLTYRHNGFQGPAA
jgi:hypothetical protein